MLRIYTQVFVINNNTVIKITHQVCMRYILVCFLYFRSNVVRTTVIYSSELRTFFLKDKEKERSEMFV